MIFGLTSAGPEHEDWQSCEGARFLDILFSLTLNRSSFL